MKITFLNLIAYLKNPILEQDANTSLKYRFSIFFQLLLISLLTSIATTPLIVIVDALKLVDIDAHKAEQLFNDMDIIQLLFTAAIAVPIIEELIFRAPITLFKKPKTFKFGFYIFSIIFGFIHIFNFEITPNVLLLSPLLVLPQLLVGSYFGYIRVRFGLQWSILLHGCYNGVLITMSFYFK